MSLDLRSRLIALSDGGAKVTGGGGHGEGRRPRGGPRLAPHSKTGGRSTCQKRGKVRRVQVMEEEEDDEVEEVEISDEEGSLDQEPDEADDADDNSDLDDEEVGKESEGLSGWADSMAKILGSSKPKHKKMLILSRAKKDYEVGKPKEKPIPSGKGSIEVVASGPSPAKKSKQENGQTATSLKALHKLELEQRRKEKEWENINRIKPDPVTERAMEKELVKIATKGVVQLFNAVSLQQKTIKNKLREARRSEFKKDKVLNKTKEIFDRSLEKSKGLGKQAEHNSSSDDDDDVEIKEELENFVPTSSVTIIRKGKENGSKKPVWQALHDDYMLDAKMKDWDQDSESDE